jgi:hypothetical protein
MCFGASVKEEAVHSDRDSHYDFNIVTVVLSVAQTELCVWGGNDLVQYGDRSPS